MANELTIPQHFPTEYAANWERLAQQKEARVDMLATRDVDFTGKEKAYNQIDPLDVSAITTRMGATNLTEPDYRKYWLRTVAYDVVKGLDEWDEDLLGSISVPDMEILAEQASAYGRQLDDTIITALGATRYVGEDGTTTEDFDTANQQVAVTYQKDGSAVTSDFTFGKLVRALEILAANEESLDETPVCLIGSHQCATLQADVAEFRGENFYRGTPFDQGEVLVNGSTMFMGVRFVRTERLPVDSNNVRSCYLYVPSGIKYASTDKNVHIDVRPDRNHALQFRTKFRCGAVRARQTAVVKILCDEDF